MWTRRAALVKAALELFSTRPYEDISVDEICTAAGVAYGLVSYYFGGKRGLFAAAVRHAWAELVSFEKPRDTEVTASQRVRGHLSRHFAYARKYPQRFTTLMCIGHADTQVRDILRDARHEASREIVASLGCPDHQPVRLAAAIRGWYAFVDSVTMAYLEHQDVTLAEATDMCTQALVAAVNSATGVRMDPDVELRTLEQVSGPPRPLSAVKFFAP